VSRRRATSRKPAKTQQSIKAKRGAASKTSRNRKETDARRLAREFAEARQQQAATSEGLRVISTSPSDEQPVYQTIVRNAVSLCGSFVCARVPF
jgi:hypothetical protein